MLYKFCSMSSPENSQDKGIIPWEKKPICLLGFKELAEKHNLPGEPIPKELVEIFNQKMDEAYKKLNEELNEQESNLLEKHQKELIDFKNF